MWLEFCSPPFLWNDAQLTPTGKCEVRCESRQEEIDGKNVKHMHVEKVYLFSTAVTWLRCNKTQLNCYLKSELACFCCCWSRNKGRHIKTSFISIAEWKLRVGEYGMDIIVHNFLESLKTHLHARHLSGESLRSQLAPDGARRRSKNCLSVFNHSANHYDCWNRTGLKTAACYLPTAVAPLWIPLHDKHLPPSEPAAAQHSTRCPRKFGPDIAAVNLSDFFLESNVHCIFYFHFLLLFLTTTLKWDPTIATH